MQTAAERSFEEDMTRLEVSLRELKVKYDQFFGGGLNVEPLVLRYQVEKLVRRMTDRPPRKYALRFHFNALVGRYNSYIELWGRMVRGREQGERRSESARERLGLKNRLLGRCRIVGPGQDAGQLRRLHELFVSARARQGKGPVSFKKFARGIEAQASRLRAKHECGQIEVRLVESDDGVQIRARPGV